MDFTQHNKINSFIPNQNRAIDCRQTPQNYNAQQFAKYQSFSARPSYQQPSMHSQQHQPQFNNQNINRNPMPHHFGDGGDRMNSMISKSFKPYSFNTPAKMPPMKNCPMQQNTSYYDDSMMMKSHEMDPMVNEDQIISSMPNDIPFWAKRQENEIKISGNNDEDLSIEYFHCPPPPPKTATINKRGQFPKSFQSPPQESMRKYSDSDDIRKALENHQTYFFSHDGEEVNGDDKEGSRKEDEEEETEIINNQNSYKSRTKIIPIPNGVRIITEIVKNEECGNEIFQNFRHLPTLTKANDKRGSKKSNITLDGDSASNNDDTCCNGNSNKKENDADDEKEEDNGRQNGIRSLINL